MNNNCIFRLLYAPCLFFIFSHTLNGQTYAGFHFGVNLSSITFDENLFVDDFNKYKPGFAVGGNFLIQFSNLVGVGGEINFERKGAEYDLIFLDMNGEPLEEVRFFNHMDYLTVPLWVQISAGKNFKGFLQAGTSFHLLVQQTNVIKNEDKLNLHDPYPRHTRDLYNDFDQSLFAGIGFSLPVSRLAVLRILTRASFGLIPIDGSANQSDSRNISYALFAGLQIPISKKR